MYEISSATSSAKSLLEELTTEEQLRIDTLRGLSEELSVVQAAITNLYGILSAGTRMSAVGAGHCSEALLSAAGKLNSVYGLLGGYNSFTQLEVSGSQIGTMIHYDPAMSNITARFDQEIQDVATLSEEIQNLTGSLSGLKARDMVIYVSKQQNLASRVAMLAQAMAVWANQMAEVQSAYATAQQYAIARAMQIPT